MKPFLIKIIIFCLFISNLVGCGTTTKQGNGQQKTETYRLSAFSMPLQTEYVYDYLGMRFELGEEVNKALESGSLFMYLDAGYEQQTQELAYARQAILYVPKEYRDRTWDNEQEVQQWKEEAQRLGYIGAYKRDVIEETGIEELTNCIENKNIGETSDGVWQYYISSNDIAEVKQAVERFRKTLVTIYEMTPFVEGVSIFAEARTTEQSIGDFQTTDIYGNQITKDIFSNYDLTLVNIVTTDSAPCLQGISELEELHKDEILKEKSINVIGIVYDAFQDENGEVIELAKVIQQKLNATYDFIIPDSVLMEGRLKGVTAFPETFFVDRQGNIVGNYYLGARPKEDWLEVIEKELADLKGENSSATATKKENKTESTTETD